MISEPRKIKPVTASTFSSSICYGKLGLDAMILDFWMLNFKSAFSLCSFISSRGSPVPLHVLPLEWCHLHIWSCWYFFHAVLIPACDSSSPVFFMMYSAFKLNKQGGKIQPCHTPFPILNHANEDNGMVTGHVNLGSKLSGSCGWG